MRYLPLTKDDRAAMLKTIGAASVEELFQSIPAPFRRKELPALPLQKGEQEVETIMAAYAARNRAANDGPFFLGAGCYRHHIPASVDYIIQRSEFLTSYTPYQPEIAQGTLQVIFQFQSMIALLTGQDIANASLYDGATAAAEAALMAMRVTRRNRVCIHGELHPHYRDVLDTYIHALPGTAVDNAAPDDKAACVIVQMPDFLGNIAALADLRAQCDKTGALLVVVVNEILALGLLPAPVEADIVCGEAQSIGLPMSFGGPHLGFFACREAYLRQMPGRLCGETLDADGKRGFVLTLNTREQHIRREKATSNICTNQGLCALAFTVHMALLGDDGFRQLARLNHERACQLADALSAISGVTVLNKTFFNEFTLQLPKDSAAVAAALTARGIIGGYPVAPDKLVVACTETASDDDIARFAAALKEVL